MRVTCAECGEELLGAVNRCWRCGRVVTLDAKDGGLPPVRQAPLAPRQLAAGAGTVPRTNREEAGTPGEAMEAAVVDPDTAPICDGSPFSEADPLPARPAEVGQPPPTELLVAGQRAAASRSEAAVGGAIAALLLGMLALFAAFFMPIGGLVTSILGLGMGAWGVYSRRRVLALVGLLLCCLALALSGFNGVVELYTYLHGHSPWEQPAPEVLPLDDL